MLIFKTVSHLIISILYFNLDKEESINPDLWSTNMDMLRVVLAYYVMTHQEDLGLTDNDVKPGTEPEDSGS